MNSVRRFRSTMPVRGRVEQVRDGGVAYDTVRHENERKRSESTRFKSITPTLLAV